MLTEKQKNNIYHLPNSDLIEMLEIIQEKLGIMSRKEFMSVSGYQRTKSNLSIDIKKGRVKSVPFAGEKFPYINS